MSRFAELAGELAGPGWIVYGGDRLERREAVTVVPWRQIETVMEANTDLA